MPQFRVEFVLDEASGKYRAELYDPEEANRLIGRTDPIYATHAEALLGLVDLFKHAIEKKAAPARRKPRARRRR